MGRQLLESSRVFRAAIERCDAALVPFSGASLVDDLRAEEAGSRMSRTAVAQPANFALQVALTDLWESLGIRPDVLIGHSAGEIAAAHLAGCLSFEDAVKVIYHRARLQDLTTGQGRLVAAAISAERAEGLPEVRDGRLAIAAVNGPEAVALVGPVPDLEAVRAALDADGVFCRFVDGHVPYHSPAMDPLRDELFACLGDVTPRAPHRPIYSTVDGARVKGAVHDAGYWWRNVREPVRFADAALAMIDDGITSFVEIGPHPALSRAVLDGLDVRGRRGLAVPTLKRTEPDAETVAHACARLYVAGYDPDLSVLHHPGPYLRLPAYPWQRERFWREAAASRADRLGEQDHSLLGVRRDVPTPTWSRRLDGSRPDYLADHRVMGATVFPGAGYVEMALAAGRTAFGASRFAVADIRFHAAVVFRPGPAYRLDTTLDPATGSVQVHGGYSDTATPVRHMSARLGPAPVRVPRLDLDGIRLRCTEQWDAARCYRAFEVLGFEYGPRFRPIERLHLGQREALGRMAEPVLAHNHDTGLVLDPVVLDGCFQMLLPLVRPDTDDEQATLLPIGVDQIVVHGPVDDARWVWATATSGADEELTGDAVLTTEDGRAVVEVRGFRVQLIGADRQHRARQGNRWLYEPVWQPQDEPVAPEPAPVGQGCWLVLGDRAGLGTAIAERLAHLGHRTVLAQIGDGFAMPAPDRYRLRPDRADLETLVREVAARAEGPVLGVVHVWSGDADLAGLDGEEPLRALDPGALTLVHLVQILDAQSLDCPLAVVTTGAQPVAGAPDEAGLAQASVWGLGRVLHHESLALHTRMFDLDPADPRADIPAFVTDLLHGDHDEDQVAWRAGVRHVARLEPARRTGGWLPVTLRPDATYLVTGGLGALGLLFARWLALRGARHIVLVARSVLPDRRSWDGLAPTDPQYATVRAIVAIEKLGATVETAGLDVAHPDALRGLLQARRVAGRPPVRGVLHCAGAVYDQVLVRMTRDQLDDVLRPKVLGGWSLHRATGSEPLDFFVLFSS
ncbi:MAG TPA: acyltransferase domain-containing protein, partial [Rugosimonospora sp.]|nr:acyltransferase domain-containing protein [Rugosimonospora sp.]